MIEYKKGNIFSEDVEALVNSVNCVGVMGRGIALQFKKSFPDNFKSYKSACKQGEVKPGRMFVVETNGLTNPRYIINFPTKRHWHGKSRMEDIKAGLDALVKEIQSRNIQTIAIPPLGSGLGGLNWSEVRAQIEKALQGLDNLDVVVYEPSDALIDQRPNRSRDAPVMTAAQAILIKLMYRYLGGLLDPFVSLLEVQKLMYFMQVAGEPLRLRYNRATYGPYAENLRHVLHKVEGHFVTGYRDGGDEPGKPLELVPGAIEDADSFLEDKTDTQERLNKVSDLVEGFEDSFGMELLASVHWVVSKEKAQTLDEVENKLYAWSKRKRKFSPRQIKIALDMLSRKGWIDPVT